jgi:predicted O-linked N-acetylglucosamine transferase (SPINDLY family)
MSNLYEQAEAALDAARIETAQSLCIQLLAAEPHRADAHRLLGRVQIKLRQLKSATESYQHARLLDPKIADAPFLIELASLLHYEGHKQEAAVEFRSATKVDPANYHAWYNLGAVLLELKDDAAAIPCFEKALSIQNDNPKATHNLGQAFFGVGAIDEALGCYMQAAKLGAGLQSETLLALACPMAPGMTDEVIRQIRWTWARKFLPKQPRDKSFADRRTSGLIGIDGKPMVSAAERPLRIGYVSSYFHNRNWMKPVWGLINRHDRSQFQISLFSHAEEKEIESGYEREAEDHVHHVGDLTNEELAALIEKDKVDILVDLNGYSEVPRLEVYQHRPAPINATWFNMFATSGLPAMDYLIGDSVVVKPEEDHHYIEHIKRLPGTYLAFEVFGDVPDVAPMPCASGEPFTFGSLCSLYKITPLVYEMWTAILKGVPDARLLLRNVGLKSESNVDFVLNQFAQRGIERERITLEGPCDHFEYLATYGRMDLSLDTYPYTGGTTTSEAIWQGVPMLTLTGSRWLPRISESILRAAGLDSFVTSSPQEYVDKAIALSGERDRLATIRAGMRDRLKASAACDCDGLAEAMEGLYRQMWKEWLEKSRPM